MCGIVGLYSIRNNKQESLELVKDSLGAIHHRGPDHSGLWTDENLPIIFGHARLSILDLSANGHQPMESFSGRYVITFNGEIYNHLELRAELQKIESNLTWKSSSDTETILSSVEILGLDKTLQKLTGMFAFGIWDKKEQKLYLARDRFGEKPLYYGYESGNFFFSSELSALMKFPFVSRGINRNSLNHLIQYKYVPSPYSIFESISKLKQGQYLIFDHKTESIKVNFYWNINSELFQDSIQRQRPPTEVINELESKLKSVIKKQMLSDVELGSFLSGGVDSSLITALMQSLSTQPINTFTIGFNEKEFDEAIYAKRISQHLKTNHTEFYVSEQDILNTIPKISTCFSEPFADSSQIPTFLLSHLTRTKVKVALSGDAGDELFGGYERYREILKKYKSFQQYPLLYKKIALFGLPFLEKILPHKQQGIASQYDMMKTKSFNDFYFSKISNWKNREGIVLGHNSNPMYADLNTKNDNNLIRQMMALDIQTYLPDDILCKVDRTSMSASLETRVPLLDPDFVKFAWSLPLDTQNPKHYMKELLFKYVPREMVERPKKGFSAPIAKWLRGPLKDWASDLLNEQDLKSDGFFDHKKITKVWNAHLLGENYSSKLWNVIMFQAWKKTWLDERKY